MPTKKHGEEHDVDPKSVEPKVAPPDRIDADGNRIGIMKASDHPLPDLNPQVVGVTSGNPEELDKAIEEALSGGSHEEQVARVKALVAGLRGSFGGAPAIHIPVPPDPAKDRNPETGNPYH